MEETRKSKLILEKTLSVFAWISLVLAVIMAALALFAALSGEENGKEIFGYKILIVNTDSMSKSDISANEEIFFNAGDLIIIHRVDDPNELKVGDVITFFSYNPESLGKTISHKIREIKYSDSGAVTGIVTYGINKGVNDIVEVKPEHIMGKYIFKVAGAGNFFSFLKTPRGFYLSVLIPGVLLIIFFSIKVGKTLGKQEYANEYNEEVDLLRERLAILENNGSTTQTNIQNNIADASAQTQQIMEENKQTTQQVVNPQQATSVVYQTINITYQPGQPAPIIYQTAPGQSAPATYQTISIMPPPVAPQPVMVGQPVIYQTVGQMPTPVAYQPGQTAPVINQTVGPQAEVPVAPVVNETAQQETVATEVVEESATQTTSEQEEQKLNIPESKKKPFSEKLLSAKKETQNYFNTVHNELVSYKKVNPRVSFRGMSYRSGRTLLAKIGLRGKTLNCYFNLNVKDFSESVYFQKDMSSVKAYEEVPFAVKVKSERGCNNATKLVGALAEKYDLKKNPKFENIDQIKEFKKNK